MITNQAYGPHSTETANLILPGHTYLGVATEPFETELRNRLHDILELWEEEANQSEDPEQIFYMIDQISDALYPPEED